MKVITPTTAPLPGLPLKVTTTLAVPLAGAINRYMAVFAFPLLVWAPTRVKAVPPYVTLDTVLSRVDTPTSISRSLPVPVVCETVIGLVVIEEPTLVLSHVTCADSFACAAITINKLIQITLNNFPENRIGRKVPERAVLIAYIFFISVMFVITDVIFADD